MLDLTYFLDKNLNFNTLLLSICSLIFTFLIRNRLIDIFFQIIDLFSLRNKYKLKQIQEYLNKSEGDQSVYNEILKYRDTIYFDIIFGIYAEEKFRHHLFALKEKYNLEWYQLKKIQHYLKFSDRQNKLIIDIPKTDQIFSKISLFLGIIVFSFGALWVVLILLTSPQTLSQFFFGCIFAFFILGTGSLIMMQYQEVNIAKRIKEKIGQN